MTEFRFCDPSGTHPIRALLVTPSSITLATLEPDCSTMQLLSWTETPDSRTLPRRTEKISGEAIIRLDPVFNEALSPYRFGLQQYDPFQSLTDSLNRAAEQGASLSLAVWAALEADLFRFAFDQGFTAALDETRGTDEWLRFARLNDLYRACVMAIAPLGIVPPAWNGWLRDDDKAGFPPRGMHKTLERILTRRIGSIADAASRAQDARPPIAG